MAKKILGTREKSSPFIRKKTVFFSGTPNLFGPSYFEAALLELVSKELNHFGVQIYSGRLAVVDLCYFALFEDFSLQK